jgi:tetratricopeptide (TPR) repeat protein
MSTELEAPTTAPEPVAAPAAPEPVVAIEAPQPVGMDAERSSRLNAAQRARATVERLMAETPAAEPAPAEAVPAEATDATVQPVIDDLGRAHDPTTGQFLPDTGEDTETQAAPEAPPAIPAEPAAAPEVPQTVRIQLPEGDIRRAAGGLEYIDVPREMEQFVRWNLNNITRRHEVEAKDAEILRLKQEQARLVASKSAEEKYRNSPAYEQRAARYQQMRELEEAGQLDEGTASEWWRTVASVELQQLEQAEFQQSMDALQQEQAEAQAVAFVQQFTDDALSRAATIPEPIRALPAFGQWFNEAVEDFNYALERGRVPELDPDHRSYITDDDARYERAHEEFKRHFSSRLKAEPAVAEVMRSLVAKPAPATAPPVVPQAALDAARRQGAEDVLRQAADRRQAVPPHPLGTLAAAARPDVRGVTESPRVDPNQSPLAVERNAQQSARQRAAKYRQAPLA